MNGFLTLVSAALVLACAEAFIDIPHIKDAIGNDTCMYWHEKMGIGASDVTNSVVTMNVECPPDLLNGYTVLPPVPPAAIFPDMYHTSGFLMEDTDTRLWNDISADKLAGTDLGQVVGPVDFCLSCYAEIKFTEAGAKEWFTLDCKDITCPPELAEGIHYLTPGEVAREIQAAYCHYTHDGAGASYFMCRTYMALN